MPSGQVNLKHYNGKIQWHEDTTSNYHLRFDLLKNAKK